MRNEAWVKTALLLALVISPIAAKADAGNSDVETTTSDMASGLGAALGNALGELADFAADDSASQLGIEPDDD